MALSDERGPPALFQCRALKHLNRAVVHWQFACSADSTGTEGTLLILLIPVE